MSPSEQLKSEILAKVAEYYRLVHAPAQSAPFVPGSTRVNYAGRVFDARELENLVDASLDFWLTYGDYSRRFEERLSTYLGVRWSLLVNSGSSANLLAFMALTSPLLQARKVERGDEVITELRNHVAHEIGPIAKPRQILIVPELPKTRSGKIMRRLLRDIAEHRDIGDTTTLADGGVMDLISAGLNAPSSANED